MIAHPAETLFCGDGAIFPIHRVNATPARNGERIGGMIGCEGQGRHTPQNNPPGANYGFFDLHAKFFTSTPDSELDVDVMNNYYAKHFSWDR